MERICFLAAAGTGVKRRVSLSASLSAGPFPCPGVIAKELSVPYLSGNPR